MGAALSRVRSSNSRIVEGDDGPSAQIELRDIRRRSAVNPPTRNAPRTGQADSCQGQEDETANEESHLNKTSKILDNVDSINKKWDSFAVGYVVIGLGFVSCALYFGIPAYYKLVEKALSS